MDTASTARVRDLLHLSLRQLGKNTGAWTLPLAAKVGMAEGLIRGLVTGVTVRRTLHRLGALAASQAVDP